MLKLIYKYRSELLMVALLAQLLLSPLADQCPHLGGVFALFVLFILLVGLDYSANKTCVRILLTSLTTAWITLRLCEAFDSDRQIFAHLAPVFGLILSCVVLWVILNHFGTVRNVTSSVISEAFISYLVIAIAFSQLYLILNRILDNPFNQVIPLWKTSTLMYFSMITLSSVGYGGIVPMNPYLRFVAALESMTGIFYIAVIVARLVSSYRPRTSRSEA